MSLRVTRTSLIWDIQTISGGYYNIAHYQKFRHWFNSEFLRLLQLRTEGLLTKEGNNPFFNCILSAPWVFLLGWGRGLTKNYRKKIQVLYDWWLIGARCLNTRFLNWGSLGNELDIVPWGHPMIHSSLT